MFYRSHLLRKYSTTTKLPADLRVYDGRLKEKVPLHIQREKPYVSFYTCGPTVYDSAHIGHASCYVRLDILQRILRHHFRMPLITAMNVTDIDDKIILRAQERNIDWRNLARHYEDEFWSDLNRLNVRSPNVKLRVTDHMPAIIRFVQTLVDKGYAYSTADGSVYFETSKYKQYGKLQQVNLEQTCDSSSTTASGKMHPSDFALWKASKPGEPFWTTIFGNGRPGWHIECSTLASHIFGSRLDFHAGGLDLRFPHHENEETQSCCYHDVPDWVTHWVHTGQLHLEGQTHKMSKSLKNTISIRELLEQHSADEFRMLCLMTHYRNVIEYGAEAMATARNVLQKFDSFFNDANAYIDGLKPTTYGEASTDTLLKQLSDTKTIVEQFLKNDFNTANSILALTKLTSIVQKEINGGKAEENIVPSPFVGASNVGAVLAISEYIREQLQVYGLESKNKDSCTQSSSNESVKDQSFERLIETIVSARSDIRLQAIETKDRQLFHVCDLLRDHLKTANIELKDHGKTSSWNLRRTKS